MEKLYFLGFVPIAILVCLIGVYFSGADQMGIATIIKRVVEYSFIVLLAFPVMRYSFILPLFIFNYSKVTLKPMLSKLSNDGVKAFGKVINTTIVMAIILWTCMLFNVTLLIKEEYYHLDFLFILFGSLLFTSLSLIMPFRIRRAARSAKQKSINVYSSHLEDAYNHFLEDPNDQSLERYNWLIQKQSVIKKIPTWPLSVMQTIFTLGISNIILLTSDYLYVSYRLGLLDEYLAGIREYFQEVFILFN